MIGCEKCHGAVAVFVVPPTGELAELARAALLDHNCDGGPRGQG